jgi:RNA polymerase sigma factor, sigma-70 family
MKNAEDAEDMTQDVFIIIFKNIHKFKFESSLLTWIYKICVNTCLNKLKGSNKYKFEELSDNIPSKYNSNPFNNLEVAEEKAYVLSEIDTLSKKSSMIVKLRLLGDKSFTEIANILNIPISSARTSYTRSRDYLKKSIIKFRKD